MTVFWNINRLKFNSLSKISYVSIIFLLNIYTMTGIPLAMTASSPRFRIGAVSKMTGVPVSTLRIWENRYSAFSPSKSEGQHRWYEEHDVSRALLLKQLTQAGHAISAVAPLNLDQLRHLSASFRVPTQPPALSQQPVRMVVVGLGLANRIESYGLATAGQGQLLVSHVLKDLPSALAADIQGSPQVLMVKVNSLQHEVHAAIRALIQKHGFAQTIVLYHFAAEPMLKAMKFSGLLVRREPLSDSELFELIQSLLFVDLARAQQFGTAGAVIPNRKYSDETLDRVARISTQVLCECPKHVAELIAQLASFEAYSQECLNKNGEDAHLHAYLHSVSGSARSLFENALERIAQHEGIDLAEGR